MDEIQLDARLRAIESKIPRCENAADIGTDHGILGAHLLMSGKCDTVQFLDISETSLRKAYRLCAKHKLLHRAAFRVGDGTDALIKTPDAAVIAGMGGQTIASIVERGSDKFADALLVLQPNVGAPELRARLMRAGFRIVDEDIARAGNRWYLIIAARRGEARYTDEELLIGPVLMRDGHPNLAGYAAFRIRVAKKALSGAEGADEQIAAAFRWEIERWEAMRL